ncbi:MAG: hypothetical protein ACE5J7_04405 [Candidatus Aenigmatarchaeota archaeon]
MGVETNSSKAKDDKLGEALLRIFIKKYGADFEGEGHVGYNNEMYLVKKNGSYRTYMPEELPR